MVAWRDEMSVGISAIDDDHKMLFSIVEEFDHCRTRQCAERVCRKLYAYCQRHFRREEEIQAAMLYSNRQRHAEEHAVILKRLTTLIKTSFISAEGRADDNALIINLGELMRDWVMGHVLHSDLAMKGFYQAAPHHALPSMPALSAQAEAARHFGVAP
jgi:hemerythrin